MPDRSASANLVESVVVNMIKFAICDDEPRMSQDLAARLAGYMEERQITAYSVSRFSGGDALLEWSGRFDVIFLDIQMDPPDGMETARLLRRRGGSQPAGLCDGFEGAGL